MSCAQRNASKWEGLKGDIGGHVVRNEAGEVGSGHTVQDPIDHIMAFSLYLVSSKGFKSHDHICVLKRLLWLPMK